MHRLSSSVAAALLAALPMMTSALMSVAVADTHSDMTPVSRVVQLLNALAQKIEVEEKQEEDLFETYMCWGKSVISQKQESNAAAEARIDRLNTYISDLDNGRIELTTERVDLEKEIAGLTLEIEQSTALRDQEKKDFDAAKTEMSQAVTALQAALDRLRQGMNKTLLSINSHIHGKSFAVYREESELLQKAVAIGSKALSKGDAVFLSRVLTAEVAVPDSVANKDWKKLNREATFKQKYEARSTKIEALLQKLLEDFSADLQEAEEKETAAVKLHTKLMTAKNEQKGKAEDALSSLDKENGARSMSKTEAIEERDALKQQVTDDKKYISETQSSMDTKSTEWKDRKALRQKELVAISQAVSILHSDDARDLFKRSYGSQGYLFLQKDSVRRGQQAKHAAEVLQQVARKTHDKRFAGLAALAAMAHFDKVIQAIDDMLIDLEAEDEEELKKKEKCESDRTADTRAAIKTSREIDELSDTITSLKTKIEEITAEIAEKEESITSIDKQLKEAKNMRDREHAEYLVAKKDDEDASAVISKAKGVLETFYAQTLLLERHAVSEPVETSAGEAPPPPPATWQTEYKGAKGESQGIVAILGMIKDDIDADLASAQEAEDEAVKAYGKTKTALEKDKSDLQSEISTLDGEKSGHESDVVTNEDSRRAKKNELDTSLKKIEDAAAYCDWLLINYGPRTSNRHLEIDGLKNAKAILSKQQA